MLPTPALIRLMVWSVRGGNDGGGESATLSHPGSSSLLCCMLQSNLCFCSRALTHTHTQAWLMCCCACSTYSGFFFPFCHIPHLSSVIPSCLSFFFWGYEYLWNNMMSLTSPAQNCVSINTPNYDIIALGVIVSD